VDEDPNLLPAEVAIGPVYPNPFNDRINIGYSLPKPGTVILTIHDQSGRMVKSLASGPASAGRYEVVWDGTSETGAHVTSGIYFCRMVTADGIKMQRLVLLR